MKRVDAGDDQTQLLEIQNKELLGENETLRLRLAKIERSKSYRLAEALKGSGASKGDGRLRRLFRVFRLGFKLIGERLRHFFFGPALGNNNQQRRPKSARKRLKRLARRMPDLARLLVLADRPPPLDRMRVLVMGVGGIGDVLSTAAVASAVKRLLAPCDVYLGHSMGGLDRVVGRNGNISDAWTVSHDFFEDFQETLAALDIFDLIVDHHYCIRYIPTKSTRINERFPTGHLLAASAASRRFLPALAAWPIRNNMLGRDAQRMGLSVLDVAGKTGLFDVGAYTPIPFFPRSQDHAILDELELAPGNVYVTVHNGVDNVSLRNLASGGGAPLQPTKLLPMSTWKDVVVRLKQAGVIVVQVGERDDVFIDGTNFDLRGRTDLSSAALVIKHAACHLDTEGGLVHLARAVNRRSVVMFGPTPPAFFGYPHNNNLAPPKCGDCWWVTPTWLVDCPRRTAGPLCMASHSAELISNQVLEVISHASKPKCRIVSSGLFGAADVPAVDHEQKRPSEASDWKYSFLWDQLAATGVAIAAARVVDVGPKIGYLSERFTASGARVDTFIDAEYGNDAEAISPERKQFGSVFNLPADDASYDVLVCTELLHRVPYKSYAMVEFLRVLRPGGLLCLAFNLRRSAGEPEENEAISVSELDAELEALDNDSSPFNEKDVSESINGISAKFLGIPPGTTIGALLLRKTS
jgi:SAM-dependent methyltransferase